MLQSVDSHYHLTPTSNVWLGWYTQNPHDNGNNTCLFFFFFLMACSQVHSEYKICEEIFCRLLQNCINFTSEEEALEKNGALSSFHHCVFICLKEIGRFSLISLDIFLAFV